MTDKQLAVLLFHLTRQINMLTNGVERALVARGATLEASLADPAVVDLRALAGVLQDQAAALNCGEEPGSIEARARTIADLEQRNRAAAARVREAHQRYETAQREIAAIMARWVVYATAPWNTLAEEITLEQRFANQRRPWWAWTP